MDSRLRGNNAGHTGVGGELGKEVVHRGKVILRIPSPSGAELPREFFGVGGRGLACVVDADVGCGFAFAGGALGEEWDQAACLIVIGSAARDDLVGEIASVDRL